MCRFGRDAESPNRCRARSTSSSEPISSTFFFTGMSPISSLSSATNRSSMPAARRSPARVIAVSGWSVSFRRRVWPLRAGFVMAAEGAAGRRVRVAEGAAGRRVRVLDIRRVTAAGIMGAISRRRPGFISLKPRTESGMMPREVRLSGLVWRHPSRATKSTVKTTTTRQATIENNAWLNRSQAINRATVTPSRSMPSPEYRSLAVRITGARVARRLAAGQSRAARRLPFRAGRSRARPGSS